MVRKSKSFVLPLLLVAAVSAAEDRLAVLEFFGRQGCSICSSAGPALTSLQHEMQGRAVLLEYDYDGFPYGRQERFWASGASATYLPLVMVGSGYRTSSGPVDFEQVYRSMIEDELARPARAAVSAFWRRTTSALRAYVEVTNLGDTDLEIDKEAMVWLVAYENASIGHSTTWVRSTAGGYLPFDLAPNESVTLVMDSPPMSGVDWDRMAGLVMVEDRPSPSGTYDMLQATQALPAGLTATPNTVEMNHRGSESEIVLTGPHVLTWSATSDVPWIETTPDSGEVPMAVALTYRPELRALLETEGTVTFSAIGDEMSFEATVVITVPGAGHRRPARRPGPPASP
jgi:hypothetical protein